MDPKVHNSTAGEEGGGTDNTRGQPGDDMYVCVSSCTQYFVRTCRDLINISRTSIFGNVRLVFGNVRLVLWAADAVVVVVDVCG